MGHFNLVVLSIIWDSLDAPISKFSATPKQLVTVQKDKHFGLEVK